MKFFEKILSVIFFATLVFLSLPQARVLASGVFNVTIDRTFEIDADGHMQVTETRTIKNNTTNRYIPSTSTEDFEIFQFRLGENTNDELLKKSVATARILDSNGNSMLFSKTQNGTRFNLEVKYPRNITSGQSVVFKLQYTNYELSEKVGALYDIYIFGFDKDFVFQKDDTVFAYNTTLIVPESLGPENFVSPDPSSKNSAGGKMVYKFAQESLIDQFVWLQLGKKQFYKFKVTQEVKATKDKNIGFYNRYNLIIPRNIDEAEINQTVYYTKIDPLPKHIRQDDDGNLIGAFEFPTDFNGEIVLEGYAEVSVVGDIDQSQVGSLSDITSGFSGDLEEADYWEVNDEAIQTKAEELKGTETNIFKIVESTYGFVVDSIDYSDVKRFGLNERQGAKRTLEGGAAVCMEYSDLFLTLSRAQGVPARAAFGYGYDSRVPSTEQEPHQWVEVYMPGVDKWVSVEVTWGESGDTLIGGDMNHFYTHLASKDPEEPAMVEVLSYGEKNDLTSPKFEISVVGEKPSIEYISTDELLSSYPYKKPLINFEDIGRRAMTIATSVVDTLGQENTILILGSFVGLVLIVAIINSINNYIKASKREI